MRLITFGGGGLFAAGLFFTGAAIAQSGLSADNYPEKSIRFIVPFPPGAANDLLARVVAQKLTERWGKAVVVDNRGGAGGVLGTSLAAKAAPDGYTIVLVPATHAINVSLYKEPKFDSVKDFVPISLIATGAYMLVVNPALNVRSVKDLISLVKTRPGQLSFGSAGTGNATHLVGELMKQMAKLDITHVPYKGVSGALTDVIGGQLDMLFGSISATNPQAKAGKVRALAVTSLVRSSAVPDVPTLSEAGVAGYDAVGWWGILAPAGTAAPIVTKLNHEVAAIVAKEDTRRWLEQQGFEIGGGSAQQFAQYIKDEIVKWGSIVKKSGARLD